MNTLPQELEDIVMDYKEQMERFELQQKIDDNNFKINSIRVLCVNREYLINKSVEDEISKTSYGFNVTNGGYMDMNEHYINSIKGSYEKNFSKLISDKLDNIRKTNLELQMEKLINFGEDIEEIDEELDEGLIVIGDNDNFAIGVSHPHDAFGIGITTDNNDYQNTFGIGTTVYDYGTGVTGTGIF